jgi:glycosyltransferase involved in cell wall biosynthesis
VRVAVVAEFYPRAADPVLGVWAHRQALAAREAGADVRVLVLHRPVPPKAAVRARDLRALVRPLRQPRRAELDGLRVEYVPFLAPPRGSTYAHWGAWAAPTLRRALRRLGPVDLVHAHYAVPAADAVRRVAPGTRLVISEHGGDVLWLARQGAAGEAAVRRSFAHARIVLANSRGIGERCRALGARAVSVVHLGADPVPPRPVEDPPRLVALGHLVARKRHADVLRALPSLPTAVFDVVGDGPERPALERLAAELGVAGRVRFRGALPPAQARAALPGATALVLPSEDEAFGVAYVEAMAAGVPAVGLQGEDGPEDIAAAGEGLLRVPPRDPAALAAALRPLLKDPARRAALGEAARETAARAFSWEACGRATVAAYEAALR